MTELSIATLDARETAPLAATPTLFLTDAGEPMEFYDAVVGWDVESQPSFEGMDYRMIRRSDGGNAGGLMRLTNEMQEHGARPVWLGYIGVDNVDATVAAIEGDGGQVMMPAWDIPDVGRIAMVADPQGAPFYVMKPSPPPGLAVAGFAQDFEALDAEALE